MSPPKSLKECDVVKSCDDFFDKNTYSYTKSFTDEVVEFMNKVAMRMYETNKVHWYTNFSKTVIISPVERIILTLEKK